MKKIKELYNFFDSHNDQNKDQSLFIYQGVRYQADEKFYKRRKLTATIIKIVIVILSVSLYRYGEHSDYSWFGIPLFLIGTIGSALIIRIIARHYLFKRLIPIEE